VTRPPRSRRLAVQPGQLSAILLAAGVLVLLGAGVISVAEGLVGLGVAAVGAAIGLAGLAIEARRMIRRISHLATLEEVDRFALHAIAGDAAQQTRRLDRLAGTSERGVRAGLAVRLLQSAPDSAALVDPTLLAGILALAPQQVVLVAHDDAADAYTQALTDLSPATTVLRLPAEPHIPAFFDRLAAKRRSSGAPAPVVAAAGHRSVHAAVWGPMAAHFLERFAVDEFLILAPPGSRTVLDGAPPHARVRPTTLGSLGLLVRRGSDDDDVVETDA
jgi:hypothetical protein